MADNPGTVVLNVTITSNGTSVTTNVTAISADSAGTVSMPSTAATNTTTASVTASVPAAVNGDRTFRWNVTGAGAQITGSATGSSITLRPGSPGLKQVTATVTFVQPASGTTPQRALASVDVSSFLFVTGSGAPVALTVNGGSGSGTWPAGSVIDVIANAPPAGQVFDKWTGDTTAFSGANANNAALLSQLAHESVTLPATPVTLTATYKAAPAWTPTSVTQFNPQTTTVQGQSTTVSSTQIGRAHV